MQIKSAPLRVKAAGPDDGLTEGQFVGYASVFGNTDSYGDIVEPGAFARTLAEWAEKGATIPVLWGHDMHDPFANIGGVTEAEEDDHGLKVTGELDLDNPTAAQVYRLMKGRRTNTMSFAYSIRDSEQKDDALHLKDLDLFEVSVVQVPANELAEVTVVKSAAEALVKAGKQGPLRELRAAIDSALAQGEGGKSTESGGNQDQEKASGHTEGEPEASDEEPSVAKSSAEGEPRVTPSVNVLAAKFTTYEAAYGGSERSA